MLMSTEHEGLIVNKANTLAHAAREIGSGPLPHSSRPIEAIANCQSNDEKLGTSRDPMEEKEHSTLFSVTQASACQCGFPQAGVDVTCIEDQERADNTAQTIAAPSIFSRRKPHKLYYVRRLPREQRNQYATVCDKGSNMPVLS